MSLEEAVKESLARNLDLQIEELNHKLRETAVLIERRPFAWNLTASTMAQSIDRPQNTREFIATGGGPEALGLSPRIFEERNRDSRAGLSKRMLSGTGVELGTRFSRLDNTLNREIPPSLFSPEHEAFTGLTITQPLWRGFGRKANEAGILAAEAGSEAAKLLAGIRAMTVVAETASRYYDLAFAVENVEVRRQALELAEQLLSRSRKLEQEGRATLGDVLEAEVALFQRQEELIEASSGRVDRENALLLLMADGEMELPDSVQPTSMLGAAFPIPSKDALVEKAREERLDMAYYRKQVEQAGHLVARAKDGSKPEFNLIASAGLNGLAGDYSDAFSEAFAQQGPEYSVGVMFSMPLGRELRRAELRATEVELRKTEMELQKQGAAVELEIGTALSRVESLLQRVATADKAKEAGTLNLKNEQQLLEEGRSTNFRVLVFQQEYSDTATRAIAARAELNKSMVSLWLSSGVLFERLGVSYPLARDHR